ncbi:hypothetical protein RRU94_18395 [Domibacillus sp. DTU_2020_1001157_1_SI_ALB_TIR_016]|nr:hypothetical protein [Domibacillus sp. DTU_2020_1001157_1_SI_ALB_TIR_016]WNS79499.1 hypothetical protein RRU94_18395 [Domibacillus sp. DTU_2020_1001157_1_SI_ALB_TIR_016]
MEKQEQEKKTGQKDESIKAMDQGFNLIVQAVNNVTGIDKSNDGKKNKEG